MQETLLLSTAFSIISGLLSYIFALRYNRKQIKKLDKEIAETFGETEKRLKKR